jgi:hypothetical protein
MSMDRCRRLVVKGRTTLAGTMGFFLASQVALGVWFYCWHADLINPNQELRFARLAARLAKAPGRGLLAVVGGSRSANGFCPRALGDWMPQPPVVFNFATLGGGPVRELLTYRQMVARGMRPDWLLAELWPGFWSEQPGIFFERDVILRCDSYLCDLPVLDRLYDARWDGLDKVWTKNVIPAAYYRTALLDQYAPFLAGPGARDRAFAKVHWVTLDDWGWLPVMWPRADPETFAVWLEKARKETERCLVPLEIKPGTDWAIRELLRECKEHGTQVALYFAPEHSALRSWYTPQAHALIQSYFHDLSEEYGVPVIDVRDWMSDDGFVDFCHLLPHAAEAFSARLGREVLRPLVEGTPLPEHLLLRGPEPAPAYDRTAPPAGP